MTIRSQYFENIHVVFPNVHHVCGLATNYFDVEILPRVERDPILEKAEDG